MLLVPRQLLRVGITGDVPYYGGRFTAEQAYAAAYPYTGGRGPRSSVPPVPPPPRRTPPPPPPSPPPAPPQAAGTTPLDALRQLLDAGVITPEEYSQLRARVTP